MSEFLCAECMQGFDLRPEEEVECPHCGSLEVLPTEETPVE